MRSGTKTAVAEKLFLLEPTAELEDEFLDMVAEYRRAHDDHYRNVPELERRNFQAYVRRLQNEARGIGLQAGRVSTTTFWLVREDGRVLGESRLRHQLTPFLRHEGGHIGYSIRISERRKGYGTRLLGLVLEKARQIGLRRVLVTCDTENTASARVIQKNGGRIEDEVISKTSGKRVSRYWITL